jgi:hypothetical protein
MSSSKHPKIVDPNRKPIVWITHDKGGFDFKGAEVHGELRPVFKGEFNPFDLHAARFHAEETMKESSQQDWLIIVGSGIAGIIVAQAFIARHDRLPLLVYHVHRREYVKRELTSFHAIQ